MKSFSFTILVCALVAPTFAFAAGAQVDISPIRLDLGANQSTVLRLRNQGADEVRFEIFAFRWEQSESGEMQLESTDAIAFFPSIFSIEPGATRQIRVGTPEGPGPVERTYRLLLKQLPNKDAGDAGVAIQVLTDFSVPVFVGRSALEARPAFALDGKQSDRLLFTLANEGSKSFQAIAVEAELIDANGATVKQVELPSWYVLAGGKRRYELELPPEGCPETGRLLLRTRLADGMTHQQLFEAPCQTDEGF